MAAKAIPLIGAVYRGLALAIAILLVGVGRGFRAVTAPELHVVGPRGEVIARDGTVLNPDEAFGPYAVCPMGETVSITGS
jgi:hypothetical protein